jgi:hypothetical protein
MPEQPYPVAAPAVDVPSRTGLSKAVGGLRTK